ncbi:LOW QUALITY PROTEIN: S_locus_glycop domain-containing protein/B_lectin domain-containing protein/Pkinase_Tyr domain-containing protein/PAN_2 domain-containing protein/DUF3403 domain-containing protein [Cephalotus follicularis]|uniref:non-specific serine/threonine protein kinase n=1 Tax=Cephalotus follicularis TaxID=3775 RepID=A0A1Q3DDN1_CEPFO|nr:LOW QUALITY PROTEIN: S_locus_glycop domain-containing protein/B_lectin domain-containing protein/Pkinase_Tyr domain-containing protein/PAN_2 domain-containing protein/DUF3403 domain-containing protein [Cephalotus follicularis]
MRFLMVYFRTLFLYYFLFSTIESLTIPDTITAGESIQDGQTIVSDGEIFELGFFSPGNSKNRYLGIWYKKISYGTVVWVANRESPITDSSGALHVSGSGILVLLNGTNNIVWSSNTSRAAQNPVAQLSKMGNFVVRDGNDNNPDNYLWQSFDYPCDTLLPDMKLGRNLVTGFNWFLSSWKSTDDPARGDYTFQIEPQGYPQLVLSKGSVIQFRAGSWNGIRWTGAGSMIPNPIYRYEFWSNEKEVSYKYELLNSSVFSRMVLNESGVAERSTWIDSSQTWARYFVVVGDQCDNYDLCGAHSCCDIDNSPVCDCLEGFAPKSPRDWSFLDWTDGCVRNIPLDCEKGDGFLKNTGIKLPDTSNSWVDTSMGLEGCKELCLKNCSCMAYANSDIRGAGSGCLMWFGDLIDIRRFAEGGQDLYIRVAASELDSIQANKNSREKKQMIITICSSIIFILGLLALVWILYIYRKKYRHQGRTKSINEKDENGENGEDDLELPIFDLATIVKATDNFSINKKLGEGGFGAVYKGTLIEGQMIAVKRLSNNSVQGLEEFKTEVKLIANLQHRNLVKLLGCCIQGDERLLIYEYMPNKSLDFFIFDPIRVKLLDWHMRMQIISGIARGLLYLHEDSRLRIIHRDLKASNVLLDQDMTPKISDFGLARIFGGDQSEANTKKVVGTYGYMSPEYAVDGLFSVKSDVFSFGVLVLEVMSGKKNRGFRHPDHQHNLLGHAWRLWTEGRPLELIDEYLGDSCNLTEVLRCIQVGLFCVQQKPEDRPNMSTVVLMFGSESSLPQPKPPGFFYERHLPEWAESSSSKRETCSTNEVTVTLKFGAFDRELGVLASSVHPSATTYFRMFFAYFLMLFILGISGNFLTLTPSQSIKDGDTLISAGGTFELGFFSPSDSINRYLGIWYRKVSVVTIVWVANRETPLVDSFGVLNVTNHGSLVLFNAKSNILWSSNRTKTMKNPIVQLLDSGNLVVKDANGMKIGKNFVTGLERILTSWKSQEDPSEGQFSLSIDTRGFPQMVVRKGPLIHYRLGSWNGERFTGTSGLEQVPDLFKYEFVFNETEVFYRWEPANSLMSRLVVNQSGFVQRFALTDIEWTLLYFAPIDQCDYYAVCGAYARCLVENSAAVCDCLDGFIPKSTREWKRSNWSEGCVRRIRLDCIKGDHFRNYTGLKLPDTYDSWYNGSMNLTECKEMCARNCSCMAYANSNISGEGSGCLLWFDDLVDMRVNSDGSQNLYIRMATSQQGQNFNKKKKVGITVSVILLTVIVMAGSILYAWKRKLRKREQFTKINEGGKEDMDLPIFNLSTIVKATDNFSSDHKLGEGGFGPVYKGRLIEGQEIAVKRLSKSSGQGMEEFKNEVILIAKLQHRNLVKLLGCCIQRDEKLLIYEYLPNKSLDYFIFDETRGKLLDWCRRMHIIGGIARGLLYLHQDSRLRIIHRDLKASNVLLDIDMNPKISDFGMARSCWGDQTQANTNRVVGTYGYMAPEYAVDGLFSVKSDVFSFGVIVLEMVSGRKNRGFFHLDHQHNLLGHAWKLWKEQRPFELMDVTLGKLCPLSQVLRCIHVGLLCVQQRPEDRPNMSSVVLMLFSETSLPPPKQPGFFTERNMPGGESSSSIYGSSSKNSLSITSLEAR